MSQHRLNLFIQPEHAKRLDELAAKKGVSKSSIVAAALASWLSPDAADQREAAIAKRLDRLSRHAERLERDQNIQIETLALFIRYFLTVSTPVPEAHQDAARAQGKARFEQFVEQLGRHLLRGRSLVRDVVDELNPDPMRTDDAPTRPKRRSARYEHLGFLLYRHVAGSPHPNAAHGDGAADRRRARDPDVVEIMLNPDRTLWIDRLSSGRAPMGVELSEADGERIIRLVAAHVGAEVHRGQPLLTAELPETGERFEGILPPAAPGPAFALRKRAVGVIPLSRYIEDGMMTAAQAGLLVRAVRERQNILIAGGTSTGKTTLANALLAEIAATGDRVLVLEDTVELQCAARDHVPLRTRQGVVSMTELVRSSMRLRPDRVVVGEVRGAEALDLIKVWGTGHPGGIATIHAGSALGALLRLEQLILEVAVNPPRALIAEAVNVVIHIAGRGRKRRIESIARVVGFDGVGYQLADALEAPFPRAAAAVRPFLPVPQPPWRTAMTQMIVPAFRISANPLRRPAQLESLARPAMQGLMLAALMLLLAGTAQAAGSSMPWEGPLQSILESIQAGGPDHRGHHHHRHGPGAGLRRYLGRLPQADPDRLWPVHRVRGFELLPVVLQLLGWGRRMNTAHDGVQGSLPASPLVSRFRCIGL